MPAEKLKTLEIEYKAVEETNKALLADVKAASAGIYPDSLRYSSLTVISELAKLKSTPTDAEICSQMDETTAMVRNAPVSTSPCRRIIRVTGASPLRSQRLLHIWNPCVPVHLSFLLKNWLNWTRNG